eukprot:10297876-Alexandrium_andersonii.AAC.1
MYSRAARHCEHFPAVSSSFRSFQAVSCASSQGRAQFPSSFLRFLSGVCPRGPAPPTVLFRPVLAPSVGLR